MLRISASEPKWRSKSARVQHSTLAGVVARTVAALHSDNAQVGSGSAGIKMQLLAGCSGLQRSLGDFKTAPRKLTVLTINPPTHRGLFSSSASSPKHWPLPHLASSRLLPSTTLPGSVGGRG